MPPRAVFETELASGTLRQVLRHRHSERSGRRWRGVFARDIVASDHHRRHVQQLIRVAAGADQASAAASKATSHTQTGARLPSTNREARRCYGWVYPSTVPPITLRRSTHTFLSTPPCALAHSPDKNLGVKHSGVLPLFFTPLCFFLSPRLLHRPPPKSQILRRRRSRRSTPPSRWRQGRHSRSPPHTTQGVGKTGSTMGCSPAPPHSGRRSSCSDFHMGTGRWMHTPCHMRRMDSSRWAA